MAAPEPVDMMVMACQDQTCDFKPMKMQRRPLGDEDVLIHMAYCGVCHTDLHIAANHAKNVQPTVYPCVPGHELAGVCIAVGPKVTKVKVGDHVGVGCMVDSCLKCSACKKGEENMCRKVNTATYQGKNTHGRAASFPAGGVTVGGYCTKMVVHEHFAILIPKNYPLELAGPVMCAGVTMYEPLRYYKAGPGTKVGIVGLGGLGITGIKIAKALGCHVTAISRGEKKKALAMKVGADSFVSSTSEEQMAGAGKSFDLTLNTIPGPHDHTPYQKLAKVGGKCVLLGAHSAMIAAAVLVDPITGGRSTMTGSMIGGIKATQEVVDLCAKHQIMLEHKVVPVWEVNTVFEALDKANDEGLRYVLDLKKTLHENTAAMCTLPPPQLSEPDPRTTVSVGRILSSCFSMLFVHWGCRRI
ncbi:unnamed protein product [Effrenium voratum]|uniref:Enoyl reductase (ER) domain-containing protein n=1 Tax=Effrenium voratum TaxID=2562239 RepID=A0AA36I8Q3_9DINO|nr:unnamed protein product [Effrenium voratum]CAJ1450230.1 unnamed protein product [Effrenium voratum]